MNKSAKNPKPVISARASALLAALLLLIIVFAFFARSFLPEYVVFSNDGPLGLQKSAWLKLPQAFVGQWYDLNTLGANAGASLLNLTSVIRWGIGPTGFAKFGAPISLWILGACAYFCFRRFGMSLVSALLGGLAACLTTSYFSNTCWGAISPSLAFGMDFLALGTLAKRDNFRFSFWIAPALAGMAVGINVMEAADIGAIFSILIAAFVIYQAIAEDGAPALTRAVRGVGRTILVAAFAGFIAAYAVSVLVGANIKGIVGVKQDEKTRAEHYDFATSWSFPKRDTLTLMVPNLFGCCVITPGAANYWGGLGTDPEWDRYFASGEKGAPPAPGHFLRHTGRGTYLGTLILLLAVWAVLQSFRKKESVFTPIERRLIWFWLAAAFVSLLLAYGRFAPFYRLVYMLPYFSTIRNPEKFLHIVTFSSIILFAYGVHGLHRRYLEVPWVKVSGGRVKAWWAKASAFERRWVVGTVLAIFLSLVAWAVYAAMRGQVESHLVELQRVDALRNGKVLDAAALNAGHDFAAAQVSFSLHQVGWFVLFLSVGSGLLLLIFSGAFAGRRAPWAAVLLGIILVGDLARADLPYVIFWNYKEKYEAGDPEPVIKFLADKPYEHRVAYLLPQPMFTPEQFDSFRELYEIEWKQQLFPYYNIQTLDIVQMPRTAQDLANFNATLQVGIKQDESGRLMLDDKTMFRLGRLWELSNTRYLLGPAPYVDMVNRQFDTEPNRFRIIQRFEIGPRPGIENPTEYSQVEAVPTNDPNAKYALYEFTGALPRANLFSNWQVQTNDTAALDTLASATFDPAKTVLVPKPLPTAGTWSATNQNPGTVSFTSYQPADFKLDATPTSPSVLMLCDKYDADWHVWVDGKESEVLRCDYLMRGVYLEPGHHQIEFRFRPNIKMFYVKCAAIFVGACLLGYVMVASRRRSEGETDAK
jgi:hypothetical protein